MDTRCTVPVRIVFHRNVFVSDDFSTVLDYRMDQLRSVTNESTQEADTPSNAVHPIKRIESEQLDGRTRHERRNGSHRSDGKEES